MIREEDLFEGFTVGEWEVLPAKGLVRRGDKEEHLEPKVLALLIALARRNGNLVTKDELIDEVWEGRAFDDQPIQRAIAVLRKQLHDTKPFEYIGTLHQRGYRLIKPVQLHKQPGPSHSQALNSESASSLRWWKIIAIAVYAAGAWVAIEAVDFAVRHFGVSQLLVEAAVIVAFGGGIVAAVLVWFHGKPGRQKAPASEILIIGSIAVATGITLYYLGNIDPLDQFENLAGYRLVLEYKEEDPGSTDTHVFSMKPWEGTHLIEGGDRGIFRLGDGFGEIRGPLMRAQFEDLPAMFFDPPDSDYIRVIFVLPYEPADVRHLIEIGPVHESAWIVTEGLDLQIDSRSMLTERDGGATIRVDW